MKFIVETDLTLPRIEVGELLGIVELWQHRGPPDFCEKVAGKRICETSRKVIQDIPTEISSACFVGLLGDSLW